MALINKDGKLLGRFNILDSVFAGAVTLGLLGIFLVQSGTHVTSGQMVEGESDIAVTVQIPNLKTLDSKLFEPGKMTAITIRNQPRGEVKIESVDMHPVRMTLANAAGKPLLVDDLSQANGYDYLITLRDHAKVTKEGYVAEGVKVKIGLPIELEGFKYRVYGKIVDVEAVQ
jgi:hypothetical protein